MSNASAEDSLLNAILTADYRTGVEEAQAAGVTAEDFSTDWNRRLWNAMVAVRSRGEPCDCSFLMDELEHGGLKTEAATQLLSAAMDGAALGGFIRSYARRTKAEAQKHRVAKAVELANSRIADGEDPIWAKGELVDALQRVETEGEEAGDVQLGEVLQAELRDMADRLNGDDSKRGLTTGIAALDEITTGINREELWVIGGLQSRGKSALALQIAIHAAGKGTPVYVVSLEMSRRAVTRRLLKMKFGTKVVEHPSIAEWRTMGDYIADVESLPLFVNDSCLPSPREVISRIRLAIQRQGARLAVVDYLQLMAFERGERREAVGEATNQLRALAKETGVPIILLSQLRRPYNINDRPTMIDLKESGDIESHAHVILLTYRPIEDNSFTHRDQIIIAKQREGPVGFVDVCFDDNHSLFRERVWESEL
jgi:replicative DNA helicase